MFKILKSAQIDGYFDTRQDHFENAQIVMGLYVTDQLYCLGCSDCCGPFLSKASQENSLRDLQEENVRT
jgi:hypothetical protein